MSACVASMPALYSLYGNYILLDFAKGNV